MKSLTKTTIIILLGVMYMTTNAQSIIVKSGFNLSSLALGEFKEDMNYSYSDEYGSFDSETSQKMLPGYHIAALVDFPFTEAFSIETGVSFSTRGNKLVWKETGIDIDPFSGEVDTYTHSGTETTKLSYLELPVAAKYRLPVNDNLNIYTQAGIYTAFGLYGTYTDSYDTGDEGDFEEKIDWDGLNRFDVGATVGAGVEIGQVMVGASYDFGLISLSDFINVYQNRNLKFSVGYSIPLRK